VQEARSRQAANRLVFQGIFKGIVISRFLLKCDAGRGDARTKEVHRMLMRGMLKAFPGTHLLPIRWRAGVSV
jgi:hypothetical protein